MPDQPPLTPEQKKELQEKLKNLSPEQLLQLQKQQCIFCQILVGKVPCKKIYEDQQSIAILDINPAAKGHTLIISKEHYAIMPQVPDESLAYMFAAAKQISQALLRSLKTSGTNIFIANGSAAGQKSPHFMLHVIPRREGDKLLEVEEQLVESEIRSRMKIALENRLNQILGIKREVVDVESGKKKSAPEKTAEGKPLPEKKSKPVKKKEPVKKAEPVPGVTEQKEEEKVSLDDIANLFR